MIIALSTCIPLIGLYLQCANAKEAKLLMEEIHRGDYRIHINRHLLFEKIPRHGYYRTIIDRIPFNLPEVVENVKRMPWSSTCLY